MKSLSISRGLVTLVDDDVFLLASKFRWFAFPVAHTIYAYRKAKGKNRFLHREILGALRGEEVNHVDGNGLNNVRANLIRTTHAGNAQGFQTPRQGKTSKFRGVRWHRRAKRWTAQIKVSGKNISLGSFESETKAAEAYNQAARVAFGALASPNQI